MSSKNNNTIITQTKKKAKTPVSLSPETREFLVDYHNFTNKWPTQKIAELPEINTTRQNVYNQAKKAKEAGK